MNEKLNESLQNDLEQIEELNATIKEIQTHLDACLNESNKTKKRIKINYLLSAGLILSSVVLSFLPNMFVICLCLLGGGSAFVIHNSTLHDKIKDLASKYKQILEEKQFYDLQKASVVFHKDGVLDRIKYGDKSNYIPLDVGIVVTESSLTEDSKNTKTDNSNDQDILNP